MAKAVVKKKPAAPSKDDFNAADKKQLRTWCSEYAIPWDKREDDEASLRKKLSAFFVKLGAAEAEENEPEEAKSGTMPHNGKRAPIDPKTGKQIDCFGWFYDPDTALCTKKCPHREACKPLSEKAAAAAAEGEADIEAEDDAEGLTEEDAEDVRKAHVKATKKAKVEEPEEDEDEAEEPEEDDEEEEKPAKKGKAKKTDDDDEDEEPTTTILTKKGAITEDSVVQVLYTEDDIDGIDFDGNDGLESLYRRVLKASEKSPSKKIKAKLIKKIAADALEIEDEDDLNDTYRSIVRAMADAKEIALVK